MKIASMISRYLLGLVFVVFGLNGFLHFIPQGPMPTGVAGEFMATIMMESHYMVPVFAFQVIGGVLLLINRYVPLGLTILAPIIVNILIVHTLLLPARGPPRPRHPRFLDSRFHQRPTRLRRHFPEVKPNANRY